MHSSTTNKTTSDDNGNDDPQQKKHSSSKPLLTFFTLTEIRKRQLIITILFIANFLFVNWLVEGDPTQGELLKIEQVLESSSSISSSAEKSSTNGKNQPVSSSPGTSWCLEDVETRHQWRLAQRYAGTSFRQTIDLCQTTKATTDSMSFFEETTSSEEERMSWKKKLVKEYTSDSLLSSSSSSSKSIHHRAKCGVTQIDSQFTVGSTNSSWMVLPNFLEFMEQSARKKSTSSSSSHHQQEEEEHHIAEFDSLFETEQRRTKLHSACWAGNTEEQEAEKKTNINQHIDQLPLLEELRNKGRIVDTAILHASLSEEDEIRHSKLYKHYATLLEEEENEAGQKKKKSSKAKAVRKDLIENSHLGTPLLQTSALSAQYVAIHSCTTPAMTLAMTTVVNNKKNARKDGDDENDDDDETGVSMENEFASFRLWSGGPLVVAAVCRAPPFEITVEVSPSASWVELL